MSPWMKDGELFLLLAMVLGIGTSDTHAQLGKVVIEAEDLTDRRFVTVDQVEGAGGGRAVHFNDQRGFLSGQVELQSGLYQLRVRGVGMGFDMDSARMTFDGRKLRAVVPVNRWGGTGYKIHIPRKGVYRVEIAFGEPHVIIDRLSFARTSAEAPTDLRITPLPLRKGEEARILWEKIVLGVAAADAEGPTTVVEVENLNDKQFVEIQEIEGASGGKAVLFADAMGYAGGQVQLKRGRYLVRIRGVGRDLDADADAADMRFAGKKLRAVVPVNKWGGNACALTITEDGIFTLTFECDEPYVILDSVRFTRVSPRVRADSKVVGLPLREEGAVKIPWGKSVSHEPTDDGAMTFDPEIRKILFAPVKVETTPRPRLFITPGELAELRQRIRKDSTFESHYARLKDEAGKDLVGACLLALISQEANDVAAAKSSLLSAAAKGASGNIYGTSGRFTALCAGLDWLYGDLTAEERNSVGRAILDFVTIYDKRPRQPDWANQMYELRGGCLLAGIVLLGAGIDDNRAERLVREYATLLKQSFVPAQRLMNRENGGMIDGTGYWYRTIGGYGRLLEAWRTYSGEDLFPLSGTRGVANWVLRTVQPHNDVFINWHDNSWQRSLWKSEAASLLQLFVKRNQDSIAKYIAQRGKVPAWKKLLWDDGKVRPAELATLPLHCHHDGIGMVTMRSGWNPDATYAAFVSGDLVGYHDWPSANIFYISKQGSLAVDASIYDNRSRMFGQHIPADSHNTVLIGRGPRMRGQAGRWTELAKGSKFDICDVLTCEVGKNYVYVVGDATRAYGGEARRFLRHFLFLLPDTFVIYDSIIAKDASTPVRWMIHGVKRPAVDAQARSMTFTAGPGRLLVRTLLPRDVQYVEDVGSYSGNGHTGFGVAVEPTKKTANVEFLHVLHCGPVPVSAALDGERGARITAGAAAFRVIFDSQAARLVKASCEGLIETAGCPRGKD